VVVIRLELVLEEIRTESHKSTQNSSQDDVIEFGVERFETCLEDLEEHDEAGFDKDINSEGFLIAFEFKSQNGIQVNANAAI
jgi:hypothetical protein